MVNNSNKERIQRAKHCLVSIGAINNENKITEDGCLIVRYLCPKKAMANQSKGIGLFAILALVFSLMEERLIMINKSFNFDQIDQFLKSIIFCKRRFNSGDLKYYLGAWLFAKHYFSYEVCNNVEFIEVC